MSVNIFIQARMSSSRYPGKMLAPFKGMPLIRHVVERCRATSKADNVIVLTSSDVSDDPLEAYLKSVNIPYYRGDLYNVVDRFQGALQEFPCDYFVRICGDSPFIEASLIDSLLSSTLNEGYDFVSNVAHRTFPKGQSVEIMKSQVFQELLSKTLTDHECEHVTPYFYSNINDYKYLFVESKANLSPLNMCVDTLEDLKALEDNSELFAFSEEELCLVS